MNHAFFFHIANITYYKALNIVYCIKWNMKIENTKNAKMIVETELIQRLRRKIINFIKKLVLYIYIYILITM